MDARSGGIHQYSVTMLRELRALAAADDQHEYVVFAPAESQAAVGEVDGRRWQAAPLAPPMVHERVPWHRRQVERVLRKLARWRYGPRYGPRYGSAVEGPRFHAHQQAWFERFGVELMIYPTACRLAFETRLPYVLAIHDLQHRLQPEFPEVSANGEFERREYLFSNAARYATLLLADSEVGREDIVACYGRLGVTPDRVHVLPYLPACPPRPRLLESERATLRARHALPERYLFYPAQFWPHKNHGRIVDALALLRDERRVDVHVVFTGSHSGLLRERTWKELIERIAARRVRDLVHMLGYVSEEDIAALYAGAEGLVMPTFFGPTNIPVLEAWACDCPVLTSDIRGIREQVGSAAVLADPRSAPAIADGIQRLWTDAALRTVLVMRGRARLAAYTAEDYRARLAEVLADATARARREGPRVTLPGGADQEDRHARCEERDRVCAGAPE